MAELGLLLSQEDFGRTRDAVHFFEGMIAPLEGDFTDPNSDAPISLYRTLARITEDAFFLDPEDPEKKIFVPGSYFAIEIYLDEDGNSIDQENATEFDNLTNGVGWITELAGQEDIVPGSQVHIFGAPLDEGGHEDNKILWFFTASPGQTGGGNVIGATRSNQIANKLVQFVNDIDLDNTLAIPNVIPQQVGSLTGGNMGYGAQEEGVSYSKMRHYKWMANAAQALDSFFMAGTNAFKIAPNNPQGMGFLNKLWIQIHHRFGGSVAEIHHMLCAEAFFEQADGKGKFSVTPPGGAQGVHWVSSISGGPTDLKIEVDSNGHDRKWNDIYGDQDDYPTDINIKQTGDDYPSSGTLYNVLLDQLANLTDINGVDTDVFNGPIGTIAYTAETAAGDPLQIGFDVSTGNSLSALAANVPFGAPVAGTGGNDDPIFWDLSKHLDGTSVSLTSLLLGENRSSTDIMDGIESVQLVATIETTPVPDNSSFDVKIELEHGLGGTEAQGVEFIRFNGDDEYQVAVYLFLEGNKDNFDPDDAATYLQKETATVDDQGAYSGATVSFTEDFDPSAEGSKVCARAYLEFFQTNVNPQPLPNQIGRCNIFNPGDFAEDCQSIVGTAATSTLEFAASSYNLESIGPPVFIDTHELRNIAPIVVTYKIQKGGDTTDFTGMPSSFALSFPIGLEIRISEDGVTADFSTITLINPIDGQPTDGFQITINYMEESLISDGQEYIGKANTVDVSDNPAPDTFTYNSATSLPASDNFGGTGTNSGTTADNNFTDRWDETNTANASQAIVANALTHTLGASVGLEKAETRNKFSDGANPNITTDKWKVESSQGFGAGFSGSGTESAYIEVENVAVDTMQAGWRDNGSGGQKYFVNINGIEEVAEASAVSGATNTIERADFTSNDFGGSAGFDSQKSLDIDGVLFNGRWAVSSNTISATINASSEIICSGTTSAQQYSFRQTVSFNTDFYMSVNFKDFSSASGGAATRAALLVGFIAGVECAIWRMIDEQGVTNGYIFQHGASLQDIEQVDASGKIALRRVGSTVTWELNDVVKRTETQAGELQTADVSARHGNDSGAFATTLFDFVLLKAGSEFLFNRVLFKNEGVLKYVFDDSGSPVTSVTPITSTTFTAAFSATYQSINIQSPTGTQFTFDPAL